MAPPDRPEGSNDAAIPATTTPATSVRHDATASTTPSPTTNTNTNTINARQLTTSITQPQNESGNPDPTVPSVTHPTTRSTLPDEEEIFDIPNFERARRESTEEYHAHVKELHTRMSGGDTTEYVESRISLPRSLQGLRTGQVINRLISLNKSLDKAEWSSVMADVVGNNLMLGSVSQEGRAAINGLKELKVEPGRTVTVPTATKPNNRYYVECLLPYEREIHVAFVAACLEKFPSARAISMPGKKSFGTTRRVRLYFNTTTAPREVFTQEDTSIPIREILLPCGSIAQIIHKWQRLNQYRPPHLLNRWAHTHTNQTYATATATRETARTPIPNPPPRSYAAATAANLDPRVTPQTNHSNAPRQLPNTPPPPRPARRPGIIPNGPPDVRDHRDPAADEEGWTSTAPLLPNNTTNNTNPTRNPHLTPSGRETTQRENATQPSNDRPRDTTPISKHTNNTASGLQSQPTAMVTTPEPRSERTLTPSGTNNGNHQTTDAQRAATTQRPNDPRLETNNVPRQNQANAEPMDVANSEPSNEGAMARHTTQVNAQPRPTDMAPTTITNPQTEGTTSASEITEGRQPKRARTRSHQSSTNGKSGTPPIRKSGSRRKTSNRFAVLDFEIQPTYEDDDTAPITVTLPEIPKKAPRRKFQTTRRAWTKPISDAAVHRQQVRHPALTLQHMSPHQTQVVLRSQEDSKTLRERLIRQIALVRAIRTNTTDRDIFLDNLNDEIFLDHVRARLAECKEPPDCTAQTPIDIPLRKVLDDDELRMRGAICYAWIDLSTRAILPHLYDQWPEKPKWNGRELEWLPAADGEVPCLQDEALALLAACPSLYPSWTHIADGSPELDFAIRTAANQWRHFVAQHNSSGGTATTRNPRA